MRANGAAAAAVLFLALGSRAEAQALGTSVAAVQRIYAEAQPVRLGADRALELHDIDYAGLHWTAVDFVFNSLGRLDHVTMTTKTAYEKVLRIASQSLDEAPSLSRTSTAGGADMQIRVCEQADGGVTVTYEAASVVS